MGYEPLCAFKGEGYSCLLANKLLNVSIKYEQLNNESKTATGSITGTVKGRIRVLRCNTVPSRAKWLKKFLGMPNRVPTNVTLLTETPARALFLSTYTHAHITSITVEASHVFARSKSCRPDHLAI
jgi:hypothetical protein